MKHTDVMAELERAGSAQARKTFARHGVNGAMFGVSYAALGKLVKSIKVDQALAEALWLTGNHDARILATMVADPQNIARKLLDDWARVPDNSVLADALARLVSKSTHAAAAAQAWVESSEEFLGQCGWTV